MHILERKATLSSFFVKLTNKILYDNLFISKENNSFAHLKKKGKT
jgi:hypothetical protein